MSDGDSPARLSIEEQSVIDNYLKRVLTIIGVPNVVFIIGALAYIFFILPDQAALRAEALLNDRVSAIVGSVAGSSASAIESSGAAKDASQKALSKANELSKALENLESSIAAFTEANPSEVAEMIESLQSSQPDLQQALAMARRLDAVEERLDVWGTQTRTVSFGAGIWINTAREAVCPAGLYAVGIKVNYGGTCGSNCDPDGGVVKSIDVLCRSL